MKFITSLFLVLISLNVFAQTADLQFIEILNNGTNYDVKVQIQASSSFNLGSSNIKFNFNSTDIGSPTLLTAHNFSGTLYNTMTVTEPNTGIASINIELFVPNNGSPVNTTWTDVATVRFTVLNQGGNSQLSFRDMNPPETSNPTVIYKDDETNQVSEGTFSPLNAHPLPVELNSFNAKVKGANIELIWKTATEVNNHGFEVERKANDNESASWEKVGFVAGNGNSNSPKDYSFTDKNITGGSKFTYRLKQIDNNGSYTYSSNVEVEVVPNKYELFQNYPNPFNPVTNIKFSLPEDSNVRINVYNILDERVMELFNADYKAGYYLVQFNSSSSGLASGMYIYSIEMKNFKAVKKMILMK